MNEIEIICKNCITLSICRFESIGYNTNDNYIDEDLYLQCFERYGEDNIDYNDVRLLVCRWYLRPDLYPSIPKTGYKIHQYIIDKAKSVYKKIIDEKNDN